MFLMSKQVILTGLRANNDLHIGHYFGAMQPIIDLANKHSSDYQINMFIPDLHSFTTPIDFSQLNKQISNNLRVFVAAGLSLDNPNVHIYRQSYIPAHSELTVILNSFVGMGEMGRMTQFKEKSKAKHIFQQITELQNKIDSNLKLFSKIDSNDEQKIKFLKSQFFETLDSISLIVEDEEQRATVSVGLFDYPVLMAADILLYGAVYVPVGDDQSQHIEFTRDIGERMNAKFGSLFTLPKPVKQQHEFFGKDQGLRIMDLVDPTKKMSKSDDTGKGVIFLSDTPEEAKKKIMSAATDSLSDVQYDYKERPGISNLLDILKLLGGKPDDFIGMNQYGPLKEAVAEKVSKFMQEFQTSLAKVDNEALTSKLEDSEKAMNSRANETLLKVQKAVGLRP